MEAAEINVLIVDDAALIRERLGAMLGRLGGVGSVRQAASVQEGIEFTREHRPDLVLLDMSMPGGSGIDVLRAIKDIEPPITVVVITNYPYEEYCKRCQELGADYFFDKTSEFHKVLDVARSVIERAGGAG